MLFHYSEYLFYLWSCTVIAQNKSGHTVVMLLYKDKQTAYDIDDTHCNL